MKDDICDFTLSIKCPKIISSADPVIPAIYTSTTFILRDCEHAQILSSSETIAEEQKLLNTVQQPFLYSRWISPTTQAIATHIALLEKGFGSHLCSSGMSAISTTLLSFLKSGDHLITSHSIYGGAHVFIEEMLPDYGVEITWLTDISVSSYRAAIKANTKVLYCESPSNPTNSIVDLAEFAALGIEKNIITIVDGTFATPIITKPIVLGIDISIHSGTKYLGGHSDILCGVITTKTEAQWQHIWKKLRIFGGILSAFDAYLLERGIKTLAIRMQKHSENAMAIAKFLEAHPKVSKTYYPGLESHPQHNVAKKQMKNGFSGMIAFELKGGILSAKSFVESLKIITLAVSLGSVESLIEHPASMTHTEVSKEERLKVGITDGLIRLSVGIEGVDDLINDLENAFHNID